MTTEKIISVLETTRLMFEMSLPVTDNDCDRDTIEAREDNEETIKAINEAIKALKRKPCVDAISREAVIKSLCELGYGDEENGAEVEYMSALWEAAEKIKALPPVTPQPKTAHWIEITNQRGTVIALRCSACKKSPKHAIRSEYCPNCGVKMVEPAEREET